MRACAEFVGYVIITLMRAIKLFFITTLLALAGCATGPEASTTVASSSAAPASVAPALDVDDSPPLTLIYRTSSSASYSKPNLPSEREIWSWD
jgi:hypothetical protein